LFDIMANLPFECGVIEDGFAFGDFDDEVTLIEAMFFQVLVDTPVRKARIADQIRTDIDEKGSRPQRGGKAGNGPEGHGSARVLKLGKNADLFRQREQFRRRGQRHRTAGKDLPRQNSAMVQIKDGLKACGNLPFFNDGVDHLFPMILMTIDPIAILNVSRTYQSQGIVRPVSPRIVTNLQHCCGKPRLPVVLTKVA